MYSRSLCNGIASLGRKATTTTYLQAYGAVRCSALAKKKSYYELMGVAPTASGDEIRAAYRSLAKSLHPDVSQEDDSEEVFAEINLAYAVLSDQEQRGKYDYLWKYEQERLEAADSGLPLSGEDAERAAALEQLESTHLEAERARRMATAARRAAERAKEAAAAQVREARRQPAAAAAAATAAATSAAAAADRSGDAARGAGRAAGGAAAAAAAGGVDAGADAEATGRGGGTKTHNRGAAGSPKAAADGRAEAVAGEAGSGSSGRSGRGREAKREVREATQAARRQAREARRHATQVRYWAQWAEQEAEAVRRAAGLEPLAAAAERLWEWQQQQKQRRRRRGGEDTGPPAWEPPAAPPE